MDRCSFFLTQGLAPSTRHVYLSAQRRYLAFCRQDNQLGPSGLPLPADEQFLMRFCTFLADSLSHASIKVYLSAVRSLHIDNGLVCQNRWLTAFSYNASFEALSGYRVRRSRPVFLSLWI